MRFFNDLSISKKLLGSLLVISTGFILFGWYSFYTLNQLKVNGPVYREVVTGKELIADILPPPQYIMESYLTAFELRESIQNVSIVSQLEEIMINKLKKEFDERHKYWVNDSIYLSHSGEIRKYMCDDSYRFADSFYTLIVLDFLPAIKRQDLKTANDLLNGQLKHYYLEHRKAIDTVVSKSMVLNAKMEKEAASTIKSRSIQLLIILIFSILTGAGVFAFVIIQILSSLKLINTRIQDLANNDLTRRLDIKSKDEIGYMARNFNTFCEKLSTTVGTISDNAHIVASSSIELSSISANMAQSAENMSSQTSSVASATEQATKNINSISTAAEQMTSSTGNVAVAVEQMNVSLNEVSRNCQKELQIASEANANVKNSKDVMAKLGDAAHSIGKVIDVISDIADKTKLLALNATIEAASAGEAGKAFAVVAGEVKELAKQTVQATQQIQRMVEEMQGSSLSAVKSIDSVSTLIEEVNTISQAIVSAIEEQSVTVNEISRNISGVRTGANDVSNNVAQSATGLNEISSSIAGVNKSVTDTVSGITQMNASARELAKLSENLKGLIGQFKIQMPKQ